MRVEVSRCGLLAIDLANGLRLVISEGLSEALVEIERYNWLWQLVEISAENIGSVVNSVSCPVESFTIAFWRVESILKFFDSALCTGESEYSLDVGC